MLTFKHVGVVQRCNQDMQLIKWGNLGSPRDNTLTSPRNHTFTSPRPVIPSPHLDFLTHIFIPSPHLGSHTLASPRLFSLRCHTLTSLRL